MKRIGFVLGGLVAGGLVAFLFLRAGGPGESQDRVRRTYARALAYYLNETNQDDRRARMELLSLGDAFRDGAAWRLDMALVDLAEYHHEVQDERRLIGSAPLLQSAHDHLQRASALDPRNPAVAYNLARTYRHLASQAEDEARLLAAAEALVEPLTREEQPDAAVLLLYGDLRSRAGDHARAHEAYSRIVALGSDFVPETLFQVAEYRQATTLQRIDPEKGTQALEALRDRHAERKRPAAGALERGRYTALVELTESTPTRPDPRAMDWVRVTERTGFPAAGTPRFLIAPDLDDDCARDVVMNAQGGLRVLRNRRDATFEDLTASAGLPADLAVTCGAAGDLDNDGLSDLVLGGPGGLRLFLNRTPEEERTKWKFEEAELPAAGAPATAVLLWDFDHDGDLDVFAGGEPNRQYRTVVEAPEPDVRVLRFEEMAATLGLEAPPATDALLLDVDDDQDVDLLVAGPRGNAWFSNLRQLRFERRELPAGGPLEAGDADNDLREEVRIGGAVHAWRDGSWARLFDRAALLDLDGDGVLDADPFAGLSVPGPLVRAFGTDLNRDGNADLLLLTEAGVDVYMSRPLVPAAWIDVRPRGLVTNEFGIGTRLRLFAGDLRQAVTCRDGLVSFGLGRRTLVDAILLRWSNGVEQGVVGPQVASCVAIEEREGEVGSCPFLYAFDGKQWHFVADCHSGTPLGLPVAPGQYLPPRSNETVFVPGDRLAPVDGRLRLDLAEEFRELFYVDQVVLRAVDHPAAARPVLNEGFRVMSFPEFRVHALSGLRPPRAARDDRGRDILDQVRARDGRHAVVFEELPGQYEGLAREWWIELDLGDLSGAGRVLLVMDGWVEFPTASASIAASQAKTVRFLPPVLEVAGPDGEFVAVDGDLGFPAGKGKAVLADLTGKLRSGDARIRIRSTQKLHWDAFLVATGEDQPLRLTELPLVSANHRFRGVGKRIEDPSGEQPWRYSHDDLETFLRWDQAPPGMLTRYGDVRELLLSIDDRYPVLASGDVVELSFDAGALPPLPEGWVRDFCFTTEGWVKDADLNQAVRESVRPLPFHAMSAYPYDEAKESHPHPDFVREWFTRPSRPLVDPAALR